MKTKQYSLTWKLKMPGPVQARTSGPIDGAALGRVGLAPPSSAYFSSDVIACNYMYACIFPVPMFINHSLDSRWGELIVRRILTVLSNR